MCTGSRFVPVPGSILTAGILRLSRTFWISWVSWVSWVYRHTRLLPGGLRPACAVLGDISATVPGFGGPAGVPVVGDLAIAIAC